MRHRRDLASDDRDRAIRRLRQLTIGIAVTGAAASGGLGFVAAVTYPGQSTSTIDSNTADQGVVNDPANGDQGVVTDPANGSTSGDQSGTSNTTPVQPGVGATPAPTFQPLNNLPTVSHRRPHIVSGGSH